MKEGCTGHHRAECDDPCNGQYDLSQIPWTLLLVGCCLRVHAFFPWLSLDTGMYAKLREIRSDAFKKVERFACDSHDEGLLWGNRRNTCYWPVAEIVIGEISDRLPSFDSLSECQLRSEQISKLDDCYA